MGHLAAECRDREPGRADQLAIGTLGEGSSRIKSGPVGLSIRLAKSMLVLDFQLLVASEMLKSANRVNSRESMKAGGNGPDRINAGGDRRIEMARGHPACSIFSTLMATRFADLTAPTIIRLTKSIT